jgi:phenylacetate-CoA ligase
VETKDGSHVWEDHFYPEIIDPESGEPLPDGEWGELVFTSLTKEACPVIRYRTRDLTRLEPGTAFPAMRRMARITGRADDMLIIRGVNVFPSQVEELILKDPDRLAPHYVIEVRRDGRLDEMTVKVEMRPGFETAGADAVTAAAHDLRHHVKSHIGVSARIDLQPAGALERSLGKAKRVFDYRT